MFLAFSRARAMLVLVAFALASPSQGQTLTKPEVAKIGKAATALVEARAGKASGSAFCINAAGLFLTNEHVVRGDAGTIRLILDSGLETQKIVQARVVRMDGQFDLALLRAEGEGKYPALPLGSDKGLGELTELVAFGFPFGKELTFDKDSFPSVTVNAGTVTRLPRKGGVLHRIQMDAGVNPGCSGGPVLDMSGKVIGVVVARVDGTTLNFAIPVSHVARFVARPDIQFTPPVLQRSNIHEPITFEARAVSLLPSTSPIGLELILGTEERQQIHAMKLGDGVYRVTAVPVPRPKGPLVLRVKARYQDKTVDGTVEDRSFRVGGGKVQLADVSRLRGGTKPQAVLHNGKTLEGQIDDLDAVPVGTVKETVTLDLAKALDVTVEPEDEEPFVFYTFVATQDGKEIGRVADTLSIRGIARRGLGIRSPALSQDKVVEQLPAPVADLAVGGGGRFLVLHLPKLGKLAVFDVNKAKITRTIPADDDAKFTAGLDKLIVVTPGKNLVQRYNLRNCEAELSVPIPVKGVVKTVAMGSASNGPLLVHWAVGTKPLDRSFCTFFDTQNMQPLPIRGKGPLLGGHGQCFRDVMHLRAAPDGSAFGVWCTSHTPTGFQTLIVAGDQVRSPYQHNSVGHVIPGTVSRVLCTGAGLFTNELQKLPGSWPEGYAFIPAQEGGYFLALPGLVGLDVRRPNPPGGKAPDKVLIYKDQDDRPLATLSNIEIPQPGDAWIKDDFTFDKRVQFVPAARLIITVPTSNDRLVLHRVDVEAVREKRSLWVASNPPAKAINGEMYRYQLEVQSSEGGLEYRLDSGPPGMTVSDSGLIEWNVPARLGPASCAVQVTLRNEEGKKLEHRFSVNIVGDGPVVTLKIAPHFGASVFSAESARLASATPQGITVWDVTTGKEILGITQNGFHQLSLSGSGERLAASATQEVRVWDIKSGKEIVQLKGDQLGRGIGALALSSDGTRLAAIVRPSNFNKPLEVKIWDAATGKELHTLAGESQGGTTRLAFSPDGKRLAAAFGNALKLWDVTKNEVTASAKVSNVQLLSFSPDGSRLAFNSLSNMVVLDAITGKELFLSKRDAAILHVAHSPDGKRLVCCWALGMAIQDARTGKDIVAVTYRLAGGVVRASFSPDGKWIALIAPTDQFPPASALKLWDASTGREALTLTGHEGVQSAHFVGPDGKLLATQGTDGTLKVWQLAK
jgi:WD40 repeat protein